MKGLKTYKIYRSADPALGEPEGWYIVGVSRLKEEMVRQLMHQLELGYEVKIKGKD